MSGLRFDGWVPFRMYWQGSEPGVEWFYMGANRFSEPFFEAAAHFEVQTPFNNLFRFRTPIGALAEWQAVSPGLKPAGFIFHLSRCGSTLITQMLASLSQSVVLSEAGVLDRMLRSHERAPEASLGQRVAWLQWLVSALGQRWYGHGAAPVYQVRSAKHRGFSAAAAGLSGRAVDLRLQEPGGGDGLELVRAASPLVTRGILGPDFLNFDISLVAGMEDDEYAARVLGRIAETAAQHVAGARGKLIEYRQLPELVWGELPLASSAWTSRRTTWSGSGRRPRWTPSIRSGVLRATRRRRIGKRASVCGCWPNSGSGRITRGWKKSAVSRSEGFETFRRLVLDNPALMERLGGLDREAFLETAVREASQAGIPLERYDVERAIAEARIERQRRLL